MDRKSQLLCTFASKNSLNLVYDYLKTYYRIVNNKIFIYKESSQPNAWQNCLLIYNIEQNLREDGLAKNTVLIHRKKQYNSFYTINGLNLLIMNINNGILDKTYQIDWSNYENKLITTNGEDLKILEIFFEKKVYV